MSSAQNYEDDVRKEILRRAFDHWEVKKGDERHWAVGQKPDEQDKSLIVAYLESRDKGVKKTVLQGKPGHDSFHALMRLLYNVGFCDGCLTGHRVAGRVNQGAAAAQRARDRANAVHTDLTESSGDSDMATVATRPQDDPPSKSAGKKPAKSPPSSSRKGFFGGPPKKPSGGSGKGGESGKGSGGSLPLR